MAARGDKMKRPAFWLAGLLLALIVALASKGALVTIPQVPATVRAGEFDTARALARLQRILGDQRPHPVDSDSNDAVRHRLIDELRRLGLEPRVSDDWACNGSARSRTVSCARVRNVVAAIGPAAGPAVLVASHYDSTAAGPGAADDGIGVAVALETAALLKGRPLPRAVAFLFDEGEEAGLLGARAFLEHDPLAARVDSVVNLEARGVTGPAIMFETSRPNGAALAAFARAAERPVANSLTADIYRLIPNSTDVTVFADRPWTMLNFAIIGNETRYHSAADTLAALDLRSVRHMGVEALAATRTLAGERPHGGGERIYADLLGRALVSLPMTGGIALLGALLLAFARVAWHRRDGIGRALATVGAALAGSGALVFLAHALLGVLRPGEFTRGHPEVIAVAVDLSALAVAVAILLGAGKPPPRSRLRAAFWLLFVALGAALATVAPGTSVFFLAPALVALAGMLLEPRLAGAERTGGLIAWALLFLSWAPLLHLGEVLLGFAGAWIFAIVSALLVLPPLVEAGPLLDRIPPARSLGATAALAAVGWIAVALVPAYSADRRQQFRVEYGWDADAHTGRWAVLNDGAALPAAFRGFRKGMEVAWSTAKRWTAPAPPITVPAPTLDKVAERYTDRAHVVTLRLGSKGADSVMVRGRQFIAVRVSGSTARAGDSHDREPWVIRCSGRSCDGLVFDVSLPGRAGLSGDVVAVRSGLPPAAAALLAGRPDAAAAQYAPDQTYAVAQTGLSTHDRGQD